MGEKLNEVLVTIPLAPHGEIVAVSKWDRVGPDLLAALEDAVEAADANQYEACWYAAARAAIAKARGE